MITMVTVLWGQGQMFLFPVLLSPGLLSLVRHIKVYTTTTYKALTTCYNNNLVTRGRQQCFEYETTSDSMLIFWRKKSQNIMSKLDYELIDPHTSCLQNVILNNENKISWIKYFWPPFNFSAPSAVGFMQIKLCLL